MLSQSARYCSMDPPGFAGLDSEPTLDQIRRPVRGRARDGGTDLLTSSRACPAMARMSRSTVHRATSTPCLRRWAPHLQRPVQRFGFTAASLVAFDVVGREDTADRGIPHRSRRKRSFEPGVIGCQGDLDAVAGQDTADRRDPELLAVSEDEPADRLCGGSHSRAKKDVATLRISTVFSSSRFLRRNAFNSAARSSETESPRQVGRLHLLRKDEVREFEEVSARAT